VVHMTATTVFFFAIVVALAAATDPQQLTHEFVLGGNPAEVLEILRPLCQDQYVGEDGSIRVTGFESDRQRLVDMGLDIVSEKKGRPLVADPPTGYRTPQELFAEFTKLATTSSTIAQLIDITTTYKAPPSHEGRHIWALKISDNVQADEAEPNILVVTNHHSRELITPELALNASKYLINNYPTDPQVRDLVNSNQIYVMWTMNPDGLAYVWSTDNMWRKNRKLNPGGSYGVDLNRNYPIGWNFSCGGSSVETSETYKGISAASEPEIQTMMIFQKDRRFAKVLDYHSYAREVRTIYADCATLPDEINNYFRSIAVDFADTIDYQQARSCCMGGNVHFGYHDQGSLAFLVETGTAFQPPREAMEEELARVLPGTLFFLNLPIPIAGRVLSRSGYPVEASIVVKGLNFQLKEQNLSNPKNGLFHIWVPLGTWTVSFNVPDHSPYTINLVATAQGSFTNIYLPF